MKKCKYAGDKSDHFCATCNGFTFVADEKEHPATDCAGYEIEETPDFDDVDEVPFDECDAPNPKNAENESAHQPKDAPVSAQEPKSDTLAASVDNYVPKAQTTLIRAESGISVEIKDIWYKLTYAEERIVPPDADIEKEREALWTTVNREVDRQVTELENPN